MPFGLCKNRCTVLDCPYHRQRELSVSDDPMGRVLAILAEIRADMVTRADLADMATRAELSAMRAAIMNRIDQLQDALTAQPQGDIVTWSAAARAEQIAKDARDELRSARSEQIGAMFRQIQMILGRLDALERKP